MATKIKINAVHAVYDTIDPLVGMKESAKGKVVLITGAGRGIGQAIAKAFAQASVKALILGALEATELEETKILVESMRPDIRVFCRALDVRDTSSVRSFIEDAARWCGGRIDVLCCNAGVSPPILPIAESDPDQWWMGLEVNLKGVYLFCRYVLPIMQKQLDGCIIITASRAAVMAAENTSSYQISKLAAIRLADSIHRENHRHGIKCFAIHPGGLATRMMTDMETTVTEPWGKEAYKFIRTLLNDDISLPGNSCVYLASGKVDFMSGRYVDTTIDFGNFVKEREAIIAHDLFKIGVGGNWDPAGGISPMVEIFNFENSN